MIDRVKSSCRSLDSLKCIAGNIMKSFKECNFEAVESELILLKIESVSYTHLRAHET